MKSATRAADEIRFRPAVENSTPQDTVALVKISFQLAY
jgi:hypothetical protein